MPTHSTVKTVGQDAALQGKAGADAPHGLYVVQMVADREGRNSYQRLVALASYYRLIVVTNAPLPEKLQHLAEEVHIVPGAMSLWRRCLALGAQLSQPGRPIHIHTQYTPKSVIAGFLCRMLGRGRWIYHLWDHPMMVMVSAGFLKGLAQQAVWNGIIRPMLKAADVWVIAMHPAVLSTLPRPGRRCTVIEVRPGFKAGLAASGPEQEQDGSVGTETAASDDDRIRICYAGPLSAKRGAGLILGWARGHTQGPVRLDLMGSVDPEIQDMVDEITARSGTSVEIHLHGLVPHAKVLQVLREADIGLCPLDPTVLNYRYAYPIKVMEYLALGLITVSTDGNGVRALVEDGTNGFVSDFTQQSFGSGIDRAIALCRDAPVRAVMADAARNSVVGREWPDVNAGLLRDLEDALSDGA